MIQSFRDLYKIVDTSLPAAEVGVAEGRNSLVFLSWGFPKLYMVDVWECHPNLKGDGSSPQIWHDRNFQIANEQTKQFNGRAVMMKGLSLEMASKIEDESLGFIYIDAGHSEEDVLQDLAAWYPKLKPGGVMAGHDYLNPAYGVYQAVDKFTKDRVWVFTIPEESVIDAGFYFKKPC